ncbi:hypothetical protein Tco_1452023 [Tanacetum coccineum]
MILVLKTRHHGPSDVMHNPSQLLRLLLEEICFISHEDQHTSISFLIPRSLILKRWQVILFSIHIGDGNPSRVNMKQLCGRLLARFYMNQACVNWISILVQVMRTCKHDDVKAKDQDIKLKSQDIKLKIRIQDHKHAKGTLKEFPRTRGSKTQDVTRSEAIRKRSLRELDDVKAKDQDIKLKSQDIKLKIRIQDHNHAKGTSKEFPRTQGSKTQDVTRSEAISAMTTP